MKYAGGSTLLALFLNAAFSDAGSCQEYTVQFSAPERVSGEPGTTVRVPVSIEIVAPRPDCTRFALSVDVRGENATVGADPCDEACAASLMFPGGDVSEVLFAGVWTVDPDRTPDDGPLAAGGPQGEGLVAVAFLDSGCLAVLPEGTTTVVRFHVDVVVPEGETRVDLSFVDGKQGPGVFIENVLVARTLDGILCDFLDFMPVSGSFTVAGETSGLARFLRGDCNDDGAVDLSDAVCTLEWLFLGRARPGCVAAMNTNGDEAVDLSDPVSTLGFLFLGGRRPVDPFPGCGTSDRETDGELGCETPQRNCSA